MLRTWNQNVENINQGQRTLGGGSKVRKALGDAGSVSENPPPPVAGKSALHADSRGNNSNQRRPLGGRSENVQASGKGARHVSDSKPKPQRRALGDISNAGKVPGGAGSGNSGSNFLSGKKPASGLKFSVHSDPWQHGGVSSNTTGAGKASGGGVGGGLKQGKVGAGVAVGEGVRPVKKRAFFVEDIEVAMGRTGDEEEALVQRKAEERAARSTNPFRNATVLNLRSGKPVSSKAFSKAKAKAKDTIGATPVVAAAAARREAVAVPSPSSPPSPLRAAFGLSDGLQINNLEGNLEDTDLLRLANDAKSEGILDFLADPEDELDWLTMPTDDLNSTPLSPLGDSFLTQELELTFE